MKRLVVAVIVVGCGGTKQSPEAELSPATSPKPVASSPADVAPDSTCGAATTQLRSWFGDLVMEGHRFSGSASELRLGLHQTLVKVDGESPQPLVSAPIVSFTADQVTVQGRIVGTVPIKDHGKAVHDALSALTKGADTLFVVDATVPWSSVVAATSAAAAAGRSHITFVFEAGAPGKVAPPPPSAVDHELDRSADSSHKATKLRLPNDPDFHSIPDEIFKNCPIKDVFAKLFGPDGALDDKMMIDGIPNAIAACNCTVEIASVQRLAWSWFDFDRPAMLGLTVDLAMDKGVPVTAMPAAPWSETSKAIVTAARAGKPIQPK